LAEGLELADRSVQWELWAIAVARLAELIRVRAGGEELRQAIDVASFNGLKKCVRHGSLTVLPWGGLLHNSSISGLRSCRFPAEFRQLAFHVAHLVCRRSTYLEPTIAPPGRPAFAEG